MAHIQDIAKRIRDILDSGDCSLTEEFRELATAYEKACTELNERLEKTVALIDRGKYEDAVELYTGTPSIDEAINVLDFSGRDEWNELCGMYELPQAPAIRKDIFEKINSKLQEQKKLEPLLEKYRSIVHRGNAAQKLSILRQIVKKAKDTERWTRELVKLEKARLQEIKAEGEKAIRAGDREQLAVLYKELTEMDWKITPDEKVVGKIKSELDKYKKQDLRRRADILLQALNEAYSDFDLEEVKRLIGKWDDLNEDSLFTPTSEDQTQANDAREWADKENQKVEWERKCQDLTKTLTTALRNRDFQKAQGTVLKLEQEDYQVPEHLKNQFNSLREEHELRQARAFKQKIFITAGILLLITIAGAFAIDTYLDNRKLENYVTNITNCLESGEISAAEDIFADIDKNNPDFLETPRLAQLHQSFKKQQAEEKARKEQLTRLFEKLNDFAEDNFSEFAESQTVINKASELARTREEKSTLSRFTNDYEKVKRKRQNKIDRQFREQVEKLNEQFQTLANMEVTADFDKYKSMLDRLKIEVNKVSTHENVSSELKKSQVKILQQQVKTAENRYKTAKDRIAEMDKMLESIWQNILPLSKYSLHIEQFLQKFATAEEARGFSEVMKLMPKYKDVVLLRDFVPGANNKSKLTQLRQSVDDNPNSIWHNAITSYTDWMLEVKKNEASVKEKLAEIENAPDFHEDFNNLHLYKFQDESDKVITFILKNVKTIKQGSVYQYKGHEIRSRKMELLNPNIPSESSRFFTGKGNDSHIWTISNAPPDSNNESIGVLHDKLECIWHGGEFAPAEIRHNKVARRIKHRAMEVNGQRLEELLLEEIKDIRESQHIASRVKITLIRYLLDQAYKLTDANGKNYYEFYIDEIDDFCSTHLERDWVKAEIDPELSGRMREFLREELPDFTKARKADFFVRDLIDQALNRQVRAVGVVKDNKEILLADRISKKKIDELWVAKESENSDTMNFYIIGHVNQNGVEVNELMKKMLFRGQPVFAPWDSDSTIKLAEEIKQQAPSEQNIPWPDCWPVNAR